MVDVTEVSAVIAATGVLVGVAYYILDIRHSREARQIEMSRMVTSDLERAQSFGQRRW